MREVMEYFERKHQLEQRVMDLNYNELMHLILDVLRAGDEIRRVLSNVNAAVKNLDQALMEVRDTDFDFTINFDELQTEYEYLIRDLSDIDEEDEECEERPCYVYYILNSEKDKVKIGISDNPTSRAKGMQTSCGDELEIMHTIKFDSRSDARNAERFLHNQYSLYRKRPTKVSKTTEWFDAKIVPSLKANYYSRKDIESAMYCYKQYMIDSTNSVNLGID